jgi:hypothetical protein
MPQPVKFPDSRCAADIGATLDGMGYRGEDGARDRAAWGTQSPRQSSSGQWPVSDESWSSASRGYETRGYDENNTEHAGYDGSRHADGPGYATDDGYARYDGYGRGDYGTDSYNSGGHGSGDYHSPDYASGDYASGGSGGYRTGGYEADGYGAGGHSTGGHSTGSHATGGYSAGEYSTGEYSGNASGAGGYSTDRYGSGSYPAVSDHDTGGYSTGRHSAGSHATDGFGSDGYGSGAYPASGYGTDRPGSTDRYGSGGYPAVSDHGSGSYQAPTTYDAPASRSGGYPTLGGTSGGYPTLGGGSGGYPAMGGRSGGYPAITSGQSDVPSAYDDGNDWYANGSATHGAGFADTSTQIAIRDPIRGYPPEPERPGSGVARTGQQLRYDESEYVSYPGYDGVDDNGHGARRGYDDYDDYAPAGPAGHATRLGQPAAGYDAPRGYGQALQGDDFDGGVYHDDYADDMQAPPGGPRRDGGPGGRDSGTGPRKPPPPRAANPKPKRGGGGTKVAVAVLALVLVGAAGFSGYKFLTKNKAAGNTADLGKPLPTTSASASAATAQCVAQFGQFCHIQSRQLDPAPLTLDDLYPQAFFSEAAKSEFARSGAAEDKDCSKAVIGADLTTQLKKGQCNQVLRGTYVSGDGTIMGTIGVINLNSTTEAHRAGKIIGKANFVMPLAGTKGPTAKLGKGTGVVEAQYKGHYLILTWAEFVNQQMPSTAALTQQLENFENALVTGTANIILSQRMINGDGPAASTSPSATTSASASTTASATPTGTAK